MTSMITKAEPYKLYIKQNLSSTQIASIKNIGSTTALNYLKKYNIPRKPNRAQIKYIAKNEYFNTWSNNMAYYLGFIAADGHVWKERPYLTIGIHKNDVEILNFIRDQISPTSKIRPSKDILQDIYDYLGFGAIKKIKNKYYELKFCQSDCIKLFNIMYKDSAFKLERKYNKFLLIDTQYRFWTEDEDAIIIKHLTERHQTIN